MAIDRKREESDQTTDLFEDDLLELPIRSGAAPENLNLFAARPLKGEDKQEYDGEELLAPAPPPTSTPMRAAAAEQAVFGRLLERGPAASNVGEFLRTSEPPRTVTATPPPPLAVDMPDEVFLESKMGSAQTGHDQWRSESSASLPRFGAPGRRIKKIFYRILAASLDASIHVAVLLFLLFSVTTIQGQSMPAVLEGSLPGVLGFLLAFSFVYYVFSLMLWRRTPGMIWAGIESCDPQGRGLTFGQALLRWIGVLITIGLAGLPVLLSILGRSASDILSGTVTRFSA